MTELSITLHTVNDRLKSRLYSVRKGQKSKIFSVLFTRINWESARETQVVLGLKVLIDAGFYSAIYGISISHFPNACITFSILFRGGIFFLRVEDDKTFLLGNEIVGRRAMNSIIFSISSSFTEYQCHWNIPTLVALERKRMTSLRNSYSSKVHKVYLDKL